jgi:hypothetical protein
MKKGETIQVHVELDFEYGQKNDWSLTAWGESGTVQVGMKDAKTDHLPHIKSSSQTVIDEDEKDKDDDV